MVNEFNPPKVTVNYNPHFYEATQISISTVEQIGFKHKKFNNHKVIGEFIKDKNYSKFNRKWIIRDVLKCWEKDFKSKMNEQKQALMAKTETVKRKKIKKFTYTSIYGFLFVFLFGIIIKANLFNSAKVILFLKRPLYNNVLIVFIYFSLMGSMYFLVTKAYYEVTRLIGNNSKRFIYQEFKTIKHQFNVNQRAIKAHLYKDINFNINKQPFRLKQIYNQDEVLINLEKYRFFIQDKMSQYSKNYYKLLLIGFFIKLILIGIMIFLGISYLNL